MTELNTLYATRYTYLLECAFNSLKLIRRTDLAETLLTDAYVYIESNQDKIRDKNNQLEEFDSSLLESIVVNWMYKQCIWSKTSFKINWVYKQKLDINDAVDVDGSSKNDDGYGFNDDILNYINSLTDEEEMLHNEFQHQSKINIIKDYVSTLSTEHQILFDIVFNKGINTSGKLSKYINISRTKCWQTLVEFKNKIKTELSDVYKQNERNI